MQLTSTLAEARRILRWRSPLHFWVVLLQLTLCLIGVSSVLASGQGMIQLDAKHMLATLADGQGQLVLRLNYSNCCVLDQVIVCGREVAAESGVISGVLVDGEWFTTRTGTATPNVVVNDDILTVTGIVFGKPEKEIVQESWQFTVRADRIVWSITRQYSTEAALEDAAFLEWNFGSMSTWTGMSISLSIDRPLTAQIVSWPENSDASRQWTEIAPQANGTTSHEVSHLRPNAIYQLKVNGQTIVSLQADKSGRVKFEHRHGYAVTQKFELGLP